MTHLHPCDLEGCARTGDPDAATLKEQRDHLVALLGNAAAGIRLALNLGPGHTERHFAARELLRQADEALANYEGAPWVTS